MRVLLVCLCLAAPAVLVACSSVGEPPPSTARAINSDISAARNSGPTAEQIGEASVVPDVNGSIDRSVVPTVTVPLNDAY
ncbi:MAG: hypothetical protein ACREEL_08810 [Stellaceae bacterium]